MIKLRDIYNEIKVNAPGGKFENFVKSNLVKILTIISTIEDDLEDATGISDIHNVYIEPYVPQEWDYDDNNYPVDPNNYFEIMVGQTQELFDNCNGLVISRIDLSYYEDFDEKIIKIPGITYQGKPVYYKTMWC